jgi:DNA-binding IclR family transcriptional regulator
VKSKIVGRTLDFLELFADQKRPLSPVEIGRLLGIPPSSCHDLMRALRLRGYIHELAARGSYYPTLRMFEVATTIANNDPIVLRAAAPLRALRDAVDDSVLLSKVNGLDAVYLMSLEPSHPLRFLATVGENVRTLHATSAGKALLASLSDVALSAFLKSRKLRALNERTITSKAALRAELLAGNQRGWFLNREESLEGVTTLSGRFNWASAVYIVTIAGPSARLTPKLANAAELLVTTCRLLDSADS